MNRKTLKLFITEESEVFGVDPKDPTNIAILSQNDFRDSVIQSIKEGKFLNGDLFEVDLNKDGEFIRRDYDGTVKIHKPTGKMYTGEQLKVACQSCIDKVLAGETVNVEELV